MVHQVSCSDRFCSYNLTWRSAESVVVPEEVSMVVLRGMLKSLPNKTIPSLNEDSISHAFLKKEIWCVLGQYTLANVIDLDAKMPLIKMYMPSGSTRESDSWKSVCLDIRIDIPLV